MTSVLQPVGASIGRPFKSAFRRRLCAYILEYVKEMVRVLPKNQKPFKSDRLLPPMMLFSF